MREEVKDEELEKKIEKIRKVKEEEEERVVDNNN